ncbi:MAG TPA: SDR family oxidoreductase [Thermoanaerobaculia bacterium]|nr:SDR family oxidoreductase [Thermoanaerobaculia bacterium]
MFAGKVAIVTGASSGIGRATAELLAERGALVAILARSEETLHEIAARQPDRILAVAGDVADLAAVEKLFAAAESRFGTCEILVNNAGMVDPKRLVDMTLDEWELAFAVNVRGAFLTSRRALPRMLAARRGAIVNVASISGVPGTEKFPGFTSYCASKGAVISMTEALAVEVKESGVRVNCVSPGSVDTPMWAGVSGNAPAAMTAAEVAETILFLASDASRPMNGQNLHVWSA